MRIKCAPTTEGKIMAKPVQLGEQASCLFDATEVYRHRQDDYAPSVGDAATSPRKGMLPRGILSPDLTKLRFFLLFCRKFNSLF